jgi:hypothetical protein
MKAVLIEYLLLTKRKIARTDRVPKIIEGILADAAVGPVNN